MCRFHGNGVVLKKTSLKNVNYQKRQEIMNQFVNELVVMGQLNSPLVARTYGMYTTDPTFAGLVMEYCPRGDLRKHLDDSETPIDNEQKMGFLMDIAQGMEYLYANGVEHRDLKAPNCLLDGDYRVKLADFGLSKSKALETKTARRSSDNGPSGTITHMAPELLKNVFTEKSDVYSFGITMWEVLSREVPFEGQNEAQIMAQVARGIRPSPIPEDSPPGLVELMKECWDNEPFNRPTFKQVVSELKAILPTQKGSAGLGATSWS